MKKGEVWIDKKNNTEAKILNIISTEKLVNEILTSSRDMFLLDKSPIKITKDMAREIAIDLFGENFSVEYETQESVCVVSREIFLKQFKRKINKT